MDVVLRWALVAALTTLIGCPSAEPPERVLTLDTSAVPDGALFVAYGGQLRTSPGSEARWALSSGALPSGLALGEDGAITGTPDWIETATVTVTALIEGRDPVVGDVTITIERGDQPVFLGFPRAPFVSPAGTVLLGDLWARVDGGGEPGQTAVTIAPGWYLAGSDGIAEGGGGDDERVGDLVDGEGVDVLVGQWWPSADVEPDPPLDPSGHVNEGSEPTFVDGVFTAGADTGRLAVTLWRDDVEPLLTGFSVVPPDWCPKGAHPRGGPSPGVCE